jgi:hypothetical protein
MNNEICWCDECGDQIPQGCGYHYASLPIDCASANAGESASLCGECCNRLSLNHPDDYSD